MAWPGRRTRNRSCSPAIATTAPRCCGSTSTADASSDLGTSESDVAYPSIGRNATSLAFMLTKSHSGIYHIPLDGLTRRRRRPKPRAGLPVQRQGPAAGDFAGWPPDRLRVRSFRAPGRVVGGTRTAGIAALDRGRHPDRALRAGLVERQPAPADGRAHRQASAGIYEITPATRAGAQAADPRRQPDPRRVPAGPVAAAGRRRPGRWPARADALRPQRDAVARAGVDRRRGVRESRCRTRTASCSPGRRGPGLWQADLDLGGSQVHRRATRRGRAEQPAAGDRARGHLARGVGRTVRIALDRAGSRRPALALPACRSSSASPVSATTTLHGRLYYSSREGGELRHRLDAAAAASAPNSTRMALPSSRGAQESRHAVSEQFRNIDGANSARNRLYFLTAVDELRQTVSHPGKAERVMQNNFPLGGSRAVARIRRRSRRVRNALARASRDWATSRFSRAAVLGLAADPRQPAVDGAGGQLPPGRGRLDRLRTRLATRAAGRPHRPDAGARAVGGRAAQHRAGARPWSVRRAAGGFRKASARSRCDCGARRCRASRPAAIDAISEHARAMQPLLMQLSLLQRDLASRMGRCPGRSHSRKRQVFGRLQRARLFLEGHRDRVVTLTELAELTSFSNWYLSKTFHSIYDECPQVASQRMRLEHACELLARHHAGDRRGGRGLRIRERLQFLARVSRLHRQDRVRLPANRREAERQNLQIQRRCVVKRRRSRPRKFSDVFTRP